VHYWTKGFGLLFSISSSKTVCCQDRAWRPPHFNFRDVSNALNKQEQSGDYLFAVMSCVEDNIKDYLAYEVETADLFQQYRDALWERYKLNDEVLPYAFWVGFTL
jgi:hypothetical protein